MPGAEAQRVTKPGQRTGEMVEVRGAGGEPPYLVRFDDGHAALVFPGPDAVIEHPRTCPGRSLSQAMVRIDALLR